MCEPPAVTAWKEARKPTQPATPPPRPPSLDAETASTLLTSALLSSSSPPANAAEALVAVGATEIEVLCATAADGAARLLSLAALTLPSAVAAGTVAAAAAAKTLTALCGCGAKGAAANALAAMFSESGGGDSSAPTTSSAPSSSQLSQSPALAQAVAEAAFRLINARPGDLETAAEACCALLAATAAAGPERSRQAAIASHGMDAIWATLRAIEAATPAKLASFLRSLLGGGGGGSGNTDPCKVCRQQTLESLRSVLNTCCDNAFVREAVFKAHREVNLSHCKTGLSHAELVRALPLCTCFKGLRVWNYGFTVVPDGVYALTQLESLDLSHNQIAVLPCELAQLANLRVLKLSWNRLDVIPPVLVYLPSLEKISVHFNPLRYYPSSVGSMKSTALLTFLRLLNDASDKWSTVRLMLVGEAAAGKTSLLRRLKSNKFVRDSLATDGIDVQTVPAGDGLSYSIWDLGGQEVFLPTHQFFLRGKAIYLLVCNIAQFDKQRLEYWLQQIEASCKDPRPPPVVLVATHSDLLSSEDEVFQRLEDVVAAITERHPNLIKLAINVSCATGAGISSLREEIAKIATECRLVTNVPHQWVSLAQHIKKQTGPGVHFASWSTYTSWCKHCGVPCPENIRIATEFLHNAGVLLHFHSDRLKDTVILDPQWLADAMATLMSFSHGFGRKDGCFRLSELKQVWRQYSDHAMLAELLLKFEIAQWRTVGKDLLLVPFLLPVQPPVPLDELWPAAVPGTSLAVRAYEFAFLPLGFIGRLICNALYLSGVESKGMWQNGVVLQRGGQSALIEYNPAEYRIVLSVRSPSQQRKGKEDSNGLLHSLVSSVDTMIEAFYPRLWTTVKRFVVCPSCAQKSSSHKPAEFPYETCVSLFSSDPSVALPCPIESGVALHIAEMAPDIALSDIAHIDASELTEIKKLGQGGMGSVTLCQWVAAPVAVKQLLPISGGSGTEADTEQFQQFQHEAYLMSVLHHPNLVKLHGIVATPPFRMVMEFLRGGDLESFLHPSPETSIPQEQLAWALRYHIAIDVALGMEHLQSVNPPVLHRDLRPGNIFLTGDFEGPVWAKVADLGMARHISPDTRGALPNWEWLAPEVFGSSEQYGAASDVYSFGLVLLELVTLERPYREFLSDSRFLTKTTGSGDDGKGHKFSAMRLKTAIAEEGLRPTIPSGGDCSTTLVHLIRACLAAKPADRPSFTQIRTTLQALLAVMAEN